MPLKSSHHISIKKKKYIQTKPLLFILTIFLQSFHISSIYLNSTKAWDLLIAWEAVLSHQRFFCLLKLDSSTWFKRGTFHSHVGLKKLSPSYEIPVFNKPFSRHGASHEQFIEQWFTNILMVFESYISKTLRKCLSLITSMPSVL